METFVGAIIENPVNGFLLQKRDSNKKIPYPGLWTLFGGKAEPGETPEQALFRELYEELQFDKGMVVKMKKFLDHYRFESRDNHQIVYHIVTNAEVSDLVLGEGEGFDYFKRDEALKLEFGFNIREVLTLFFKTN